MILFKFNLNFHFWQLVKALILYVPGKMQHLPNFLISIFDYQVIFHKHSNAIKYSIFLIIQGCIDLIISQSKELMI